MEAGGAGAAALGLAACGDDYFAPKAKHKRDAPNTLLIVTDSTRADYVGAYNHVSRNKTPNLDALAKDSLLFDLGGARGDAHRPGAPRAAHGPAVLPLPQLGAHPGVAD